MKRYEVIAFICDRGLKADSYYVNSLRTLRVLEKKVMSNSKYDSWAIIDQLHIENSNKL